METLTADRVIDPETIRPAVKGESDKFSWRLYRWIKKHGDVYNRVYSARWNCIHGAVPDADPYDFRTCTLYLGRADSEHMDIFGSNLKQVTAGNPQTWCLSGAARDAVDITDWFWTEYLRIGRCLIHGDLVHSWRYADAWDRTCRYCGKREVMHRKVQIEYRDEWRGPEGE